MKKDKVIRGRGIAKTLLASCRSIPGQGYDSFAFNLHYGI